MICPRKTGKRVLYITKAKKKMSFSCSIGTSYFTIPDLTFATSDCIDDVYNPMIEKERNGIVGKLQTHEFSFVLFLCLPKSS